jgi:hypothetical protein
MADPKKQDELNRKRAEERLRALEAGLPEFDANMIMLDRWGNNREKATAKRWLKNQYEWLRSSVG